jgi:hypothetical protein
MTSTPKNGAHSIYQKLMDQSKENGADFNHTLSRYGIERLLYRLSLSQYSQKFILKGASLFLVWLGETFRVTRDVDLLGYGNPSLESMKTIFTEIITIPCQSDGIVFTVESLKVESIREANEYDGVRITLVAQLYNAKIPIQIDVGFGDAITPESETIHFPTLMKSDSVVLQAYPKYTLLAEKIEAMCKLGIANSRLKDFHDICLLSRLFEFDGQTLKNAMTNTFNRRNTPIPSQKPTALTPLFYKDLSKISQWKAFIRKAKSIEEFGTLEQVILEISEFLNPFFESSTGIESQNDFHKKWNPRSYLNGSKWI